MKDVAIFESDPLIITDPTLTPPNISLALDTLPDAEWEEFGEGTGVPRSVLDKIKSDFVSDAERKTEFLRVFATEHPQPTWEHLSDSLYQFKNGEYHHVLERLQALFPTGKINSLF